MAKGASRAVHVNKAKVSFGRVGGQFVVLHVPTDQMVALDEAGQRLWQRLTEGLCTIESLIALHAEGAGVSAEAAAYQVGCFLEELGELGIVRLPDSFASGAPKIDVLGAQLGKVIDADDESEENCQPRVIAMASRAIIMRPKSGSSCSRGKSRQSCKTMCV